jgi:hypothetical protein
MKIGDFYLKQMDSNAIPAVEFQVCPNNCYEIFSDDKPEKLVGYTESVAGFFGVFECQVCFEKFRFHLALGGREEFMSAAEIVLRVQEGSTLDESHLIKGYNT